MRCNGDSQCIVKAIQWRLHQEVAGAVQHDQVGGGPSNIFTSLHLSVSGRYKEELPPRYRNLEAGQLEDSAHWGAGVWLADFCPTVVTMEAEC